MRRWLIAFVVVGVVAIALRGRSHQNEAELTVAVLKDVVEVDGHGLVWSTHVDAVSTVLWQHDRARLRGGPEHVSIDADGWRLELTPTKVFGVMCHVRGGDVGDYPEYGFITFLPEGGDVFDSLFSIGFGGSIPELERICAKHGLRVER